MAIVGVNATRRERPNQERRSGLDVGLDRLLKGLDIASTAYGISVNMDRAKQLQTQTSLTEQQMANLPSPEEAAAGRQAELNKTQSEIERTKAQTLGEQEGTKLTSTKIEGERQKQELEKTGFATEQELKQIDRKTKGLNLEQLEREQNFIREDGRGVTDAGKPMSQPQLVSQSFLDRGIAATDRMKELSPRLSPEVLDRTVQSLEEVQKMPIIGSGLQALKTMLGANTLQRLNDADRQYLINLYEVAGIILRDETGAAQTADEVAKKMIQLAPRAGNTADDLELKAKILEDSLSGLRTKTGRERQPITNMPDVTFNFENIQAQEEKQQADSFTNQMQKRFPAAGKKKTGRGLKRIIE